MNFGNIVSNTGEDFIEEFASLVVYENGKEISDKLRSYLNLNPDSNFDEALESALSTLTYGIMNAVIVTVVEYAVTKSGILIIGLVSYIKSRRTLQALKQGILNNPILKRSPLGFAGSVVAKSTTNAIMGNQQEVLAIAQMVNSSGNNIISNISQERQNQIMLRGQKLKRVQNEKQFFQETRNKSRDKNMDLFMLKFDKAMWKNTQKDKKLYLDCTGLESGEVSFTTEFVAKLNSYANVVTTLKGEVFNSTKATLDLLTLIGSRYS